ncbi:MAG: hypothetical protein CR982_07290 [Candidatus Cloacimonadota bacterium]|nr:MAG: hypothetical protein CR982_07290 [Candidatus Cloacimonadota bacterium]PIE79459.1 MAG: hypothetical protein CSA15_03135 [Candidatus Delongbacteria bacterium]
MRILGRIVILLMIYKMYKDDNTWLFLQKNIKIYFTLVNIFSSLLFGVSFYIALPLFGYDKNSSLLVSLVASVINFVINIFTHKRVMKGKNKKGYLKIFTGINILILFISSPLILFTIITYFN